MAASPEYGHELEDSGFNTRLPEGPKWTTTANGTTLCPRIVAKNLLNE